MIGILWGALKLGKSRQAHLEHSIPPRGKFLDAGSFHIRINSPDVARFIGYSKNVESDWSGIKRKDEGITFIT